jgi:hypothetical protein
MALETDPLRFGELHAPPVIIARGVLGAEFNPPGLIRGTFGRGNMGLKFNRIGPAIGDSVDVSMRCAEAAVMCLGNFRYDHTRFAGANAMTTYF